MRPTHIVVHCSDTADSGSLSWAAIRRFHTETLHWGDIGYHFGIELVDGVYEVLVGRMPNVAGAHCRNNGMNRKSLGVCFVGKFDESEVPAAQWRKGVELVAGLVDLLEIPVLSISGHREHDPNKTCPGARFNMGAFREDVIKVLGARV